MFTKEAEVNDREKNFYFLFVPSHPHPRRPSVGYELWDAQCVDCCVGDSGGGLNQRKVYWR